MKISPATTLRTIQIPYFKRWQARVVPNKNLEGHNNGYQPVASASTPVGKWILRGLDYLSFTQKFAKTTLQLNVVAFASPFLVLPICACPTLKGIYWRLLSDTAASLGPTSIKFLQWATSRRDLFPEGFCHYARRVQASVPPDPFPFVLLPIAAALAANDHTEVRIDARAVGSGSVAQVHSLLLPSTHLKFGVGKKRRKYWATRAISEPQSHVGSSCNPSEPLIETVVKVLRPFVRARVVTDLWLMRRVAVLFNRCFSEDQNWFPIVQSVDQFAQMILPQSDLRREAENLVKFGNNFNSRKSKKKLKAAGGRVIIPQLVQEIGTPEMLVETKEYGLSFDHWLKRNSSNILQNHTASPIEGVIVYNMKGKSVSSFEQVAPKVVARVGANMYMQMLLLDNFIHIDMHPGNLLVRLAPKPPLNGGFKILKQLYDSNYRIWKRITPYWPSSITTLGDRIMRQPMVSTWVNALERQFVKRLESQMIELVVLDAGLTLSLSKRDRSNFVALFGALAFGEGWEAGRLILERAKRQACDNPDGFCMRVAEIVAKHVGPPIRVRDLRNLPSRWKLNNLDMGGAMQDIMRCSLQYKVELDPAFVGIVLATSIVEGFGKILDPDIDLLAVARPFLQTILLDTLEHAATAASDKTQF